MQSYAVYYQRDSNDRVTLPLEHAEHTGTHGDEIALRVSDLRLGRGGSAGAVGDLAFAGDEPPR